RTVGLLLGAAALLLYGPADAASARRPRSAIRPRPRLELAPRQAASLHLHGPEASLQLLATRVEPSGLRLDRTPMVRYDARPGGVVHVSAAGQVAPLRDGTARITAREGGTISRPVLVQVSDSAGRRPPSFTNEIVPLFTRAGCNGGSCHGRTGGQAGFELSLFGFEPQEDHARFAADRRRLNPSAPGESLLLRKATAQVPHRGGRRWESNSPEYRAVLRWIARMGDPVPPATEAVRLEVTPAEQTFAGGGTQQLAVLAYFADGSVRDVTDRAVFESNLPDDVEVSREGRVRVGARPGVGAVMARYQSLVGVFRAVTRRGPEPLPAALPGEGLEALLARQWRKLGLAPSPPCDDGTFLRRATLDLVGRLPTLEETRAFLADRQPDRDARLVDRLLASEEYADHFAGKWSALLRNRRAAPNDDPAPTAAFHRWIRDSLHADRPFDRFAGEIVTAAGDVNTVPQTVWYREVRDSAAQAEDVAQLFLGQRIACARCHHHPQERWSQRDYYGLAAFFSRVRVEDPPAPPRKQGQPAPVRPPLRVEHQPGPATLRHPRTNAEVPPVLLGGAGPVLSAAQDPRAVLAAWFSEPANPYFARTLVNRYWKHFFGRGLVDPEDDMRSTNPAPNPELLEYLAGRFRAGGFSLKRLVRLLCTSRAYRLSSEPTARNG
ncbi:MAG: DUF1549 domain-containing protein, partial [Armatimonadetes bacterium]|nr:DUF1549 domain-containing protein [Armatimonadota bacterium]